MGESYGEEQYADEREWHPFLGNVKSSSGMHSLTESAHDDEKRSPTAEVMAV